MIIKGDHGSLEIFILTKEQVIPAFHGEGWLHAAVYLDIPCITAKSSLYITLGEIKQFAVDLSRFLKFKTKEIQFETVETYIYLHFTLTETGNVDVLGKLKTSTYNEVNFIITTDLATLDRLLIDLKIVINSF